MIYKPLKGILKAVVISVKEVLLGEIAVSSQGDIGRSGPGSGIDTLKRTTMFALEIRPIWVYVLTPWLDRTLLKPTHSVPSKVFVGLNRLAAGHSTGWTNSAVSYAQRIMGHVPGWSGDPLVFAEGAESWLISTCLDCHGCCSGISSTVAVPGICRITPRDKRGISESYWWYTGYYSNGTIVRLLRTCQLSSCNGGFIEEVPASLEGDCRGIWPIRAMSG